ncbi:MAG TPA: hypothetical protein VFL85_02635, partial [Candidatus Saccharimonadales bacterium]|nr:hypothetical protein [Candidatus Saccharimonadales bacterium]
DRTTLYVTWGKALAGVWKLSGADNLALNASGVKQSGSGSATRLSGGPLTTSTACGPIAVDPTDGSIVVLVPGYSGTPDAIMYDGSSWTSIADNIFREVSMLPVWVAKRGNRIYTSQTSAGVPFATYK